MGGKGRGALAVSGMVKAAEAIETANANAKAEDESEIKRLQKAIEQLQQLKTHLQRDKYANLTLDILSTIVDDLCTDVCVDVHRSLKMDLLYVSSSDSDPSNRVVDVPGYDIYGQVRALSLSLISESSPLSSVLCLLRCLFFWPVSCVESCLRWH